jgi:thiol-disulfide isomerase/thioredoxin
MTVGAWVLVVAVVAALGVGLWRAATDGRFRGTHAVPGAGEVEDEAAHDAGDVSVLADTPWSDQLGPRATLLQFSSAFCAPCRAARRVLGDVATLVPGVVHLEVDAEHHLDVVRRLGVLRTPTTLVLDARGRERVRASGAPTKDQVLAALASLDDPATGTSG